MKWRKRRISAEGISPSVTAHPRCPQAAAPKRPNAEPRSTRYRVRGHWFCLDSASATHSLSICNTKMPAHEWDPLKSKKQINLDWGARDKRIKVQGPRSCGELLLGKNHRCPLGLHFLFLRFLHFKKVGFVFWVLFLPNKNKWTVYCNRWPFVEKAPKQKQQQLQKRGFQATYEKGASFAFIKRCLFCDNGYN